MWLNSMISDCPGKAKNKALSLNEVEIPPEFAGAECTRAIPWSIRFHNFYLRLKIFLHKGQLYLRGLKIDNIAV